MMETNKIQMYYLQNNISQVVHDVINVVLDRVIKYGILNYEFEFKYDDKFYINNDDKLVQFNLVEYEHSFCDELYEIAIRTNNIPVKKLANVYHMSIEGMIIDALKDSIISDLIDDIEFTSKLDNKTIMKRETNVIKLTLKSLAILSQDNH